MEKAERERLRQDCQNFIGRHNYYYPFEANTMISLLDHIDALEQRLAEYKPVDAVLIEDCDEGSDKRYGRVLVTTENCIQTLYRHEAIVAAPEPKQ